MKKLLIIVSLFMTSILGFANVKPLDVDVTEGTKLPNFELRDFQGKYTKSKKTIWRWKTYTFYFCC
jgi:alkyl hydroperoxide reductase/ thiol specific antioxidant/ mal allergen